MALTSYDDILAQVGASKWQQQPIWGELQTTAVILGGNNFGLHKIAETAAMPGSLPSTITDFIPSAVWLSNSSSFRHYFVAKLINLGSLDISGASGTFTDGNAMPSEVELGNATAVISGPVWLEVTTALNATPGSITITYKDNDGNTGQVSTSQALGASAPLKSGGWITLATGDTGVQDITAAARTAGTTPTGVIKFWGLIPLCMVTDCSSNVGSVLFRNMLTGGFNPYPLGVNDVIGLFCWSLAVHTTVGGIYLIGGN